MPELPEVETIRQDLSQTILNKKIKEITVHKPKIIQTDFSLFKKNLLNHSLKSISRIGKLLIFSIANSDKYLLIHLKMTGQLIYQFDHQTIYGGHGDSISEIKVPNKHTHVIFSFADNSKLFYNDLRQFGYLKIVDKSQKKQIESQFGIEPLTKNFTIENFQKLFSKNRKITLKQLLLDQKSIAGIGNIYADEICFQAQIRPDVPINQIPTAKIKKICLSTINILQKSIKYRGTTFNNYRDSKGQQGNFGQHLKVYHRTNEICLKCHKSKIKKIKIAGRSTHFCPICQK